MKILVTAFDPFGGESVNPAELAVGMLPERIGDAEICRVTVPTVYALAAERAIAAYEALRPDAVVCIGQAGGRAAVTPERVAINAADARIPDNHGNQPVDQPIAADGPAAYFSTLPIRTMEEAIRALDLPAAISNTAGTFVCNDLMYRMLHHVAGSGRGVPCGFIHVPFIPEQTADKPDKPSMPLEDILRALTAALEVLVHGLQNS